MIPLSFIVDISKREIEDSFQIAFDLLASGIKIEQIYYLRAGTKLKPKGEIIFMHSYFSAN